MFIRESHLQPREFLTLNIRYELRGPHGSRKIQRNHQTEKSQAMVSRLLQIYLDIKKDDADVTVKAR